MARRRRELDEADDLDIDDDPPIRRRRRPRWSRRFLGFVLLVVGAVAALPTIIAKTPLRDLVLSSSLPADAATLTTAGGSFSWIAGQSLTGITLTDAAGQSIAQIESVMIDRSLVALAANGRHLGKIVVTRPVIYLETRTGGSNIEDLVGSLANAAAQRAQQTSGTSNGGPTLAELEIVEGTILSRDATTGQLWRIDAFNASARPSADSGTWDATGTGVLALATSTDLQPPDSNLQPDSPGRFKFTLHRAAAGPQQLDLLADRIPLAPLEPFLARVLPAARILGTTSADLKFAWTPTKATGSAGELPTDATPPPTRSTGGAGGFQSLTATGKLDAADVRFTADALAGDLVELRTAAIALDATVVGQRLTARQLTARSDWLQAEAAGDFDLAQLASVSPEALPATNATLTARVDLPQLTRMLPRTLRLRPGVRIDSGSVEVTARSEPQDAGRHWALAASVENLAGHDGVRPIRWTQPVEAGLDLAEAPAGPQLKRILLRSPFASITADGAAGGLEGSLEFNLDELARQLGQFVDLAAWQLHGAGKGKFSWRDTGPDKFAASASLDLNDIDVRRDDKIVWVDSNLHVELQSSGIRLATRPLRLETATALMRGASDSIEVELLEPVDLTALSALQRAGSSPTPASWFLRIKGDGPLDSWAGRLRPWIAAVPDELAGQSTVNARVRLNDGLVEIVQSQLSIRDLRTRVAGVEIIEPRVEAGGDFRWDASLAAVDSQKAEFASSSISGAARGLSLRFDGAGPPTVRGDIALRGDLERIATWLGMVGAEGGLWPRGQAVGRIQLASDANRATANVTIKSEPFTLVRTAAPGAAPIPSDPQPPASSLQPATVAWHEPNFQFATELTYDNAEDRVQLTNLKLDGQTAKLAGGGVIEQFRTAGLVRGEATLTYDSAELAKLLTTYLGPGVRIQGATPIHLVAQGRLREKSETINGTPARLTSTALQPPASSLPSASSHWSRRWQLTTDAGFTAANLYGLPVGQAQLNANIRDGQAQIAPLDLAVGQGRLAAQPRVLLDPAPRVFQLAAGPLVSNVSVSAEVSDAMLKYAAPILANATRISGTFSLFTEGVSVPLEDPKKLAAKGRVTMHELSILPGPGLADVVALIQQLERFSRTAAKPDNLLGALTGQQPAQPVKGITMREQTIDVQVVDGRVYHRNLEFLVDDVPVTSYGSVGFDQSIALVLSIPVQEKWVRGTPALHGLIGQKIEIPVSGTFTQWNVDQRAVGNFLSQAAQTAVGGALGDELNKALEGLFRRK